MKEMISPQATPGLSNSHVNDNGETSTNNVLNDNNSRKYAMVSTDWISAIGEELGMHPLPESVLKRLAEDASYRLREVLHKCVMRLKHSRKKRLTTTDVNAVITKLYDADPVYGVSESMPEYNSEAKVFVPNDHYVDVAQVINEPLNITQYNVPYLEEMEVCDIKLTEARHSYAKRALKTLFNGTSKTFQVLLNDCAINTHVSGEGVVDVLISIARSMIISNNAQYTRVSTRTCQLIMAIASNNEAVYPFHLTSVDKLTELLLELLLGQSFLNPILETLFKDCVVKLMLRWPSTADKFIPTLEKVISNEVKENDDMSRKRVTAMELLAGVRPSVFLEQPPESPLSLENVLIHASPNSVLGQSIALSTCAFMKSRAPLTDLSGLLDHYGDSLLPYLPPAHDCIGRQRKKPATLPIIIRSKIKYVDIKPSVNGRNCGDRQGAFLESTLEGPRKEIRFAFAGGRPVPVSNLRRVSLRANYQILRSDLQATMALVASHRLLALKDRKKPHYDFNLADTWL